MNTIELKNTLKNFDIINKIENKIEALKNNIYTYVYNRNLNNYNYVREFEKKYLW